MTTYARLGGIASAVRFLFTRDLRGYVLSVIDAADERRCPDLSDEGDDL